MVKTCIGDTQLKFKILKLELQILKSACIFLIQILYI
jgi:hypothetical protein